MRKVRTELSVFLTSSIMFSFLVLVTPVVSSILISTPIYLIQAAPLFAMAISMILLRFAGVRISSVPLKPVLNFLSLFSVILVFLLLKTLQKDLDLEMLSVISISKDFLIEQLANKLSLDKYYLLSMAIISLPFLFYGSYLYLCFDEYQKHTFGKLYSFEILGIVAGSISMCLILDYLGFTWALTFIFFLSSLSHLSIAGRRWSYASLIFVFAISVVWIKKYSFEPIRNEHLVARDFNMSKNIEIEKVSWSTYSQVQTLNISDNISGEKYRILSLGAGTGHARIFAPNFPKEPETILVNLKPKNALVLFAGGGADILGAQKQSAQNIDIEGVEINRLIIEHAKLVQENVPPIHISDARNFLKKTRTMYDLILYSWSGATLAHYSGAIMYTSEYLFTTEGLTDAISRLNKNGYLVFFGASKINLLLSLKKLGVDVFHSTILLQKGSESWISGWDGNILIFKNGVINDDDLGAVRHISKYYRVVFAPNLEAPEIGDELISFLKDNDFGSAKRNLNGENSFYFDAHTDDRPFVYSIKRPSSLLSLLRGVFSFSLSSRSSFIFYGFLLSLLTAIVIFIKKRKKNFPNAVSSSAVMFLTGTISTTCLQYAVYKFIFLVGNPTLAIVFANLLMLFSYFGALMVGGSKSRVSLALATGAVVGVLVILSPMRNLEASTSIGIQISMICLILYLSSMMFNLHLNTAKNERPNEMLLFLTVNLFSGATSSLFVPLAVENLGMQFVFRLLVYVFLICLFIHVVRYKKALS